MSQQSISGCRVCETLHHLCSLLINPPPPYYYLRTIPYSLLNPCLQGWCHTEHILCSPYSTVSHLCWHLTLACRLWHAHMHTNVLGSVATYTNRMKRQMYDCKHTQCKLAKHNGKCTHGWWATRGVDVSRSLPFIITAALVIPTELCPPVLLPAHTQACTFTNTGSVVIELTLEVAGGSGIEKVCASCLLTAPLGLVKFDLMAFLVN